MGLEYLVAKTLVSTSGDDMLTGYKANDDIKGGNGKDYISGREGNDILSGESGADTLDGGPGDDILDGGAGNDFLTGSNGDDTFILRKGSGVDTINGRETENNGFDRIIFKDITPGQIRSLTNDRNQLIVNCGTSDQVFVGSFFESTKSQIEEIQFSDGTILDVATIKQKTAVP